MARASLILLGLLVVAAAGFQLEPAGTSRHLPPLLDCAPAPAPAPTTTSNNSSAFRANVLSLLGDLPSAAAAAPRGSTAELYSGSGDDQAFARGLCFLLGSSPGDCLACLSAAAHDVASRCDAASRRAGVWRPGCFLSYADTNASTARQDAFGGWFYDDSDDAALQSQCAANRTAAECARCLNTSAQVVPRLKEGNQLSVVHGDTVVVVGYGCYMRVPLSPPVPLWQLYVLEAIGGLALLPPVVADVSLLLYCFKIARGLNPVPA